MQQNALALFTPGMFVIHTVLGSDGRNVHSLCRVETVNREIGFVRILPLDAYEGFELLTTEKIRPCTREEAKEFFVEEGRRLRSLIFQLEREIASGAEPPDCLDTPKSLEYRHKTYRENDQEYRERIRNEHALARDRLRTLRHQSDAFARDCANESM